MPSTQGLSQSGSVWVAELQGGGLEETPPCSVQWSLPPRTAFPTVSIERSADLVEPVFRARVMAVPQSADWRLGPSLTTEDFSTCG